MCLETTKYLRLNWHVVSKTHLLGRYRFKDQLHRVKARIH